MSLFSWASLYMPPNARHGLSPVELNSSSSVSTSLSPPTNPRIGGHRRVCQIDRSVGRERKVGSHFIDALAWIDVQIGRQSPDHRHFTVGPDELDVAGALGHDHSTVGQEVERERSGKSLCDRLDVVRGGPMPPPMVMPSMTAMQGLG